MEALPPALMVAAVFGALLLGYPVALTLAGVALLFALGASLLGLFSLSDFGFLPGRLFGILTNQTLIAVPLFVFMGAVLEKTRTAEALLDALSGLLGGLRGGLALAVVLVGALMAASTGIIGATVVTLGLMALPYVPNFAEYLALINSGRILGDQMDFLRRSFGADSRLLH